MRRGFVFVGVMLAVSGIAASAQRLEKRQNLSQPVEAQPRQIPPEMSRRYAALDSQLQPSVKSWIDQQAKLQMAKPAPDVAGVQSAARNRFSTENHAALSGGDIDSLVFAVMMQAANSSEQDLQQQLAQMKAVNDSRDKMRSLAEDIKRETSSPGASPSALCKTGFCRSMGSRLVEIERTAPRTKNTVALPASANPTYADLKNLQDSLKNKLDSMNEMSEMTSMRLQMAMDRRSKFLEALSNIMKKMNDTSDSVVKNLK